MITNKNEVETLKTHILCDSKWKFDSTTYSSKIRWNNEMS